MNYENRVVIYLDLLGFKNLIDKTVLHPSGLDNTAAIDGIVSLYDLIRDAWHLDSRDTDFESAEDRLLFNKARGKVVTIFSDSIVISFLQDAESEVFSTLYQIQLLIMNLVNRGVLCRGAVSYGKLIHTDKMVFGPALNEAYLTEDKIAIYPRIIVSKGILDIAIGAKSVGHTDEEEIDYIKHFLLQDEDGQYYIDFISSVQAELDEPEFGWCDYLMKIRKVIVAGLLEKDEKIVRKYDWLKKKFNDVIDTIHGPTSIENLEKERRGDIISYYSQLEKIK